MARLLVVEDDPMFAALVHRMLGAEGHTVDAAADCARARTLALAGEYDGIVLDVSLPDCSGLAFVRELRGGGRATPVLLLTGHDRPADVVRGLDAGADDYLTKPFDPGILSARVRALVRRGGTPRTAPALAYGGLLLDREGSQLTIDGRRVACTPREFALLSYLAQHAGRVVTRGELLGQVWGASFDPGTNVVDVHVARLRVKLREFHARPHLATVRGAGYMLTLAPGAGVADDGG